MRRRATILCLLLVCALAPTLAAKDDPHRGVRRKPVPAGIAVVQLRKAVAADDEAAIEKLAQATWPDPFEVAGRMLFPMRGGAPMESDRAALARFAAAASSETGVRAFIEHWLAADDAAFARERQIWIASARMNMRMKAGKTKSALEAWKQVEPVLAAAAHSNQGPLVRRVHAQLLRHVGRAPEAVAVLEDLVARLVKRRWPAQEGVARFWLAELGRAAGRADTDVLAECVRAERLLTEARNSPVLVSALGLKATLEGRLGRHEDAERSAYRAMAVARQTGSGEAWLRAQLYAADAAAGMGRAESARTMRARAFDHARESKLIDLTAWAAEELVLSELAAGRTAKAMAYGDWLEDHRARVVDPHIRGDAALALGDLEIWRGRRAQALARYQDAVAAYRGAGSPARVFSGLGRIVRLAHEDRAFDEAAAAVLPELRRVAELAATASDTVPVLADWSRVEQQRRRHEEARRIAQRAVAYARKHPSTRGAHLAPLQLAGVEYTAKRYDEAIAILEPLLDVLPTHEGIRLMGLNRLGLCYMAKGRWPDAVKVLRDVVTSQQSVRAGVAARDALWHRAAEHVVATRGVAAAVRWHAADGGQQALEAAWWFREMAGGRLLESAVAQTDRSQSEALIKALNGLELAHGRLMTAVLEGSADAQTKARAAVTSAYEKVARAEARAARRVHAAEASTPTPWTDVRAALPADTAILAYALGPDGAFGLALTKDGGHARELGTREEVRTLVTRWRRLAATPEGPDEKLAARAYAQLVKPFEDRVGSRGTWIVLPDGALSGVPFDALVRPTAAGPRRLIESHTVTYAQGHGVLAALAQRQAARAPGRGLVALGDPTYPAREATVGQAWQTLAALERGGLRMRALASSGTEARRIADLYPDKERTLLLRENAERTAWLTAVGGTAPLDCVHLACHGLVDDHLPSLSGLVFARGEMLTAERLRETRIQADLAVLSACQSGGETVAAGEGLLGLTRAFFRAGVTRVLCTTWQVADASTADLMVRFHTGRMRDGLDDATALRRARLALLREKATVHPYYWAGFQLWGSTR